MGAKASKQKRKEMDFIEPMENVGPGQTSLYFKNVGLFDDPYLAKLSEPVKDDFMNKNWESQNDPAFSEAYEWMLSTWKEMKEVFSTRSEPQLENQWIQPVLSKLGWTYEVQDRLQKWGRTEIPDYSLFESKKTYLKANGCKTDEAYFEHVSAVADAKKMGVPLDGSKLDKTNPSYQIMWYQQITGKTWGILTDGKYWRLYSLRAKSRFTSYYEVNIEKMLAEKDDEQFKYFYNFFRKEAFVKLPNSDQCFLDIVFEKGERYAREVETRLKERAFHLVEIICAGFASNYDSKLSDQDLAEIYQNSLQYLFRLMFVLNCEAKGLFNVDKQSNYYVHSLRSLCMQVKSEHDSNVSWSNLPRSFNHINMLFGLLASGDEKLGIHGFGKEIFGGACSKYFKNNPIPDDFLNKVLIELAFAYDKKEEVLRLIDYKRLSADHLGSLFEGLLEFKLVHDRKLKLVDSREKKATGSYYTPDYVVDFIVKETLKDRVANRSVKDLLKMKIIDPAMGSGHFLLGVVKFLEEEINEKISLGDKTSDLRTDQIRREVLHNCIVGADINALAVELSKFSLWIYSAQKDESLEPLNDQLICKNSLESDLSKSFDSFLGKDGHIAAVVGNPPWGAEISEVQIDRLNKRYPTASYKLFDTFKYFIAMILSNFEDGIDVGLIVPRSLLTHIGCRDIREHLLKNEIRSLIDLGDGVFEGVTCPTCIVVVKKGEQSNYKFNWVDLSTDPQSLVAFDNKKFEKMSSKVCFEKEHFEFVDNKGMDSLKEKGFRPLAELANVFDSGLDYSRKALGDEVFYKSDTSKSKGDLPVLRGKNINRFHLGKNSIWLKKNWKEIETRQKKQDPKTRLKVNEKAYLDKVKILVRQTADEIIGTLDSDQNYNQKSLLSIHPKSEVDVYFLLGILNSAFMTTQYRGLVHEEGQVFSQVKKNKLEQLLIPVGIDKKIEMSISDISKRLTKLNLSEGKNYQELISDLNQLVESLVSRKTKRRAA